MKLAVIGGGSTYTPELVDGLIRGAHALPIDTLTLMDIDQTRLSTVGGFVRRMIEAAGVHITTELSMSLDAALRGADFVITQIRVGGQGGRDLDCRLGMKYGLVGQETTGVGGFANAMRTIPVMLDICHEMQRWAPQAWLLNFANPSGIITEAVVRHGGVPVIGLCNVPVNMKVAIAEAIGVPAGEISVEYVGLNHLSWIRRVYWKGRDMTERALQSLGQCDPGDVKGLPATPRLFRALRMHPSPYLRYFYRTTEVVEEQQRNPRTRAQTVMEIESKLLELYRDPNLTGKPEALSERGGAYYSAVALDVISSICNDSHSVHIVDVPNRGAVDGFPDEAVMELPAVIDGTGACPLRVGALGPEIRGLVHMVKAYEELTVAAAVERSYDLALLALTNNPLVPDAVVAERLLDELVASGRIDLG